jgi:hypothetical protein
MDQFLNLILGISGRIKQAVTAGAQFEIWMQVELYLLLLENRIAVARELNYADNRRSLDLLIGNGQGDYAAVELKVQSGGPGGLIGGKPRIDAVEDDIRKVREFKDVTLTRGPGGTVPVVARWVVAIVYGVEPKQRLRELGQHFNTLSGEGHGILVMVIDADTGPSRLRLIP